MRKTAGLTIFELLVSAAIMSIIGIGIFNVLMTGQGTFATGIGQIDLQGQARVALTWIGRELREASSVTISPLGSDDDLIVFSTPGESSIRYYRDVADSNSDGASDQLIREYPSGTYRIIASRISSLEFSENAGIVDIDLAVSSNSAGAQVQRSLKRRVALRN